MEYYNVIANYKGRLTFMWSEKFNGNSLGSQGKSGNFYYQREWEPCKSINSGFFYENSLMSCSLYEYSMSSI